MSPVFWSLLISLLAVVVLAAWLWRPLQRRWWHADFDRVRREFLQRREHLEARFFDRAARSGKPRGLRWSDIDFGNDVAFARDRKTGELAAFVSATIAFEAVVGGDMEEVEAVSNLRAATAVFHYRNRAWDTDGRVMFNLSPPEAIAYCQQQIEPVSQRITSRS